MSAILIDSVFRTRKNYPRLFLEKCKYAVKVKKMARYITDDVENSSDENSGKGNSNKENSDEENHNEE